MADYTAKFIAPGLIDVSVPGYRTTHLDCADKIVAAQIELLLEQAHLIGFKAGAEKALAAMTAADKAVAA